MQSSIFCLLLMLLACFSLGDIDINTERDFMRHKLKGRSRDRGFRMRKGMGKPDLSQPKAVNVQYPQSFFSSDSLVNWKTPAVKDLSFIAAHETSKPWLELAKGQDMEEIWLYENWFYGMTHGVIMESGALNGILFSNSYMFEMFANWTAIHVEADPENYASLKHNRDGAINIHGALCSEPKLLHYSSLGVIPVRGFVEFMTPSFLKKWHGSIYNNRTDINSLPTVQCIPTKNLLRELGVNHVDVWILDVEGAEESVLRGTDFSTVRFNAIAMECDEHDVSKNERKTNILETNGFTCTLVRRNCMCKHNSYEPSSAPVKSALRIWDGNKYGGKYVA